MSALDQAQAPTRRLRPRRLTLPATRSGRVGWALILLIVVIALLGPLVAPYDPATTVGAAGLSPGGEFALGTDFLGRDVLSRVLNGGGSVLLFATIATIVAYAGGLLVGLTAGYLRRWPDQLLMRAMDLLLSFPQLVFILLLAAALGTGVVPVLVAAALIQIPSIARIVRAATLEQSVRGYVEAAVARGERAPSIIWREILPNIQRSLAADVGVRFTWSVVLIASVNFLGLGLQPPASDWGVMVSENRAIIALNPVAMLVPALLLGTLTVAINLASDALAGDQK